MKLTDYIIFFTIVFVTFLSLCCDDPYSFYDYEICADIISVDFSVIEKFTTPTSFHISGSVTNTGDSTMCDPWYIIANIFPSNQNVGLLCSNTLEINTSLRSHKSTPWSLTCGSSEINEPDYPDFEVYLDATFNP